MTFPPPDGLPPGLRQLNVPSQYENHPLVTGKTFYTIPNRLIRHIKQSPSVWQNLDRSLLEMEQALGELCGDHSWHVGFASGIPIRFLLLFHPPLSNDEEVAAAEKQLNEVRNNARAYSAWLLTNPQFMEEHANFFKTWKDELARNGLPTVIARFEVPDHPKISKSTKSNILDDYVAFLKRWRLELLAGPHLPSPVMTHEELFPHGLTVNPLRESNVGLSIPDTAPLPTANDLQKKLEQLARSRPDTEHLLEWTATITSKNANRFKKIARFSKLFPLIHFWRVLHERHPNICEADLRTRYAVFSQFIGTSEDTIRTDMEMISGCLGPDWYKPHQI